MKKLEDDVARRSNEFIDAFIARGECDYADEFAVPLPCSVFLALMGLPLEDLIDFLRLKELILRGSSGDYMNENDPLRKQAQVEAVERFERLIALRRKARRTTFSPRSSRPRLRVRP